MTVLLLDLDDTLLGNSMDSFLPAYLQALGRRLAVYGDPGPIIQHLLAATRQMTANNRPDRTLAETFDAAFFPALNLPPPDLRRTFEAFYAQDFPALQRLTQTRPEAVPLVKEALRRGYLVGVATNPLFPATAIEQRLAWAGLPPAEVPFALIPSYQTFHFSKPNPAYFAEFLAQLGWPEGPVLMVGDDPELDLLPARALGLAVFWVRPLEQGPAPWHQGGDPPPQGGLADLLPWLDQTPPEQLQPQLHTPQAILAVLRATPAALDTLCRPYQPDQLTTRPAPAEWAPAEVLCHLRDVEAEVNLPRLRKVLAEDNPFISGQETDSWADQRQYLRQNGRQASQAFIQARIQLLDMLQDLAPSAWQRPARHAIFGPTRLLEMANIIATHDRLHLRQFLCSLKYSQTQAS